MAQWSLLIIRIVQVAKFFVALAIGYKTMAGVSWYQVIVYILDCLPRPKSIKDWTPDEWQRVWDKAQGDY